MTSIDTRKTKDQQSFGDPSEQCARFFQVLLGDRLAEDEFAYIWHLADNHTDWAQTPEAAESSAATHNGRHDVYTGVAFTNRRGKDTSGKGEQYNRVKIETATTLAGLVGDFDYQYPGAHKEQDGLPPDEAAARALIDKIPLKPTMIVHSGHGLQAWWLFKQPWVFENAEQHGQAIFTSHLWQHHLQLTGAKHGWKVDQVGSLAQQMRVPGTVNAKDPQHVVATTLVSCDPDARYLVKDFLELCRDDKQEIDDASTALPVGSRHRFTKRNPCPVCGSHKNLPSGTGARCWGFYGEDGRTVWCMKAQYAGSIPATPMLGQDAFAHSRYGRCLCGVEHNPATSLPTTISNQSISRHKPLHPLPYQILLPVTCRYAFSRSKAEAHSSSARPVEPISSGSTSAILVLSGCVRLLSKQAALSRNPYGSNWLTQAA